MLAIINARIETGFNGTIDNSQILIENGKD